MQASAAGTPVRTVENGCSMMSQETAGGADGWWSLDTGVGRHDKVAVSRSLPQHPQDASAGAHECPEPIVTNPRG
jgi:hypothetical protein